MVYSSIKIYHLSWCWE